MMTEIVAAYLIGLGVGLLVGIGIALIVERVRTLR
jgi:xanthosine utilization system XapX-like protein